MRKRIVLHPKLAPPGRIRVWVGAAGYSAAPALSWSLDGAAAQPAPVRPLESARTAPMLANTGAERVFTGVYELNPGGPRRPHVVAASDGSGVDGRLVTRPLPAAVPADDWFRVLLVSCYYRPQDKSKLVGTLPHRIPAASRPDMSILMGDQVYLDLPTLKDFRDDERWLAERFERDYSSNWLDLAGYGRLLHEAPSVCTPDDHEYWNNFPHAAAWIQNSWREGGQRRWERAAMRMLEAFQHGVADEFQTPPEIDVDPVSIFVMDNRSFRQADRSRTAQPEALDEFEDWIQRVIDGRLFGVLVTGQPLFEKPVRGWGPITDRALANYGDYGAIVGEIAKVADAGLPMVLLTGDKHWGRVLKAVDGTRGSTLFEVVCSPSSLVTTPGKDQAKIVWDFLARKKDPWPRHSTAADPPDFPPPTKPPLGGSERFRVARSNVHKQKGNQVAVLAFKRAGPALQMKVTYYPLHARPQHSRPTSLDYTLRRATP